MMAFKSSLTLYQYAELPVMLPKYLESLDISTEELFDLAI